MAQNPESQTTRLAESVPLEQPGKLDDVPGTDSGSDTERAPECAVCLQTCIHPVQLPCSHVFCYLCVKGVANQSKRCALCRSEIPVDFLYNPQLVYRGELSKDTGYEDGQQWFYEGRNGWWQYDERTSAEMEEKYKKNLKTFDILIAGFLYVIDLESMIQYRRNDPTRRRRIKRDLVTIEKKGVAGIKLDLDTEQQMSRDGADGVEEGQEEAISGMTVIPSAPPACDGAGDGLSLPQVPNNTPASPEAGSPGAPSSPSTDDLSATMAQLELHTTSRRHLPRHHRHMLSLADAQAGRSNITGYRAARIRLLDTPSSSSDSDWEE